MPVRLDVTTLSYNPQQYTKGHTDMQLYMPTFGWRERTKTSITGIERRQETKGPEDSNTESHRAEWSQKSYGFKAKDDRHYPTGYIYCWESDCHCDYHIG